MKKNYQKPNFRVVNLTPRRFVLQITSNENGQTPSGPGEPD